jgi:hypothetical protein
VPEEDDIENNNNTYKIPEENIKGLEEAIYKLNKRAEKLSCPPIHLHKGSTETEEVKDGKGLVIGHRVYHHVVLTGEAPRIPGWTFEGAVDFSDPAINGFMLRMAPGASPLPKDVRKSISDDPKRCDHCNARRNRKETFIVRNEEGSYYVVGRTCLKDFTGHTSPNQLASYYTMLNSLLSSLDDEESGWYTGGRFTMYHDIVSFLVWVCMLARTIGFVSRREERENDSAHATAGVAWNLLNPVGVFAHQNTEKHQALIEDSDREMARKVIEFTPSLWAGKDENELSDYVLNMKNTFGTELVSSRTAGLVASAYRCYERHLSDEAKKKLSASLSGSAHQGKVKQRLTLTLTCYNTNMIEGMYGSTQICKFADEHGNVFVWFNSGRTSIQTGEKYTLKGTVKKHAEFRGIKETHLTRCAIQ